MDDDARWQAYVRERLEPRNAQESVYAWKCGRPAVHEPGARRLRSGGGSMGLALGLGLPAHVAEPVRCACCCLTRRDVSAIHPLTSQLRTPRPIWSTALTPLQFIPCPLLLLLPLTAAADAEANMFQTELDFGQLESEAFTRDVYQRCARHARFAWAAGSPPARLYSPPACPPALPDGKTGSVAPSGTLAAAAQVPCRLACPPG